jgi:Na+-driven multidrug efflux pump
VARARKGVRHSLIIGAVASFAIAMTAVLFAKQALRIFTPEADVLDAGAQFMRVMTPYNWILVFAIIIPGALRGAGSVKFSTAASVISFVLVRQIYLFIITKVNYTIAAVGLGYPITWALAGIAITIFYMKSDWSRFEPEKEAEPDAASEAGKGQDVLETDAASAEELGIESAPDAEKSEELESCPGKAEREELLAEAGKENPD